MDCSAGGLSVCLIAVYSVHAHIPEKIMLCSGDSCWEPNAQVKRLLSSPSSHSTL